MKNRNTMKPHLRIDPWAHNRWDKPEVFNLAIKHQTQTQRGIPPFTGENQEYERGQNRANVMRA